MILAHDGKTPSIHPTARVAPNATICGDVTIGANSSVGFGAVLTAESGPVEIGANCVVMDTAVLRGVRGSAMTLGDNCLVGPRAHLTGCAIEDNCFIATGAAIFNGARIGTNSEVRINGIVHLRTVLAPGSMVPIGWVAVGDPAEMFPPDRHDDIWAIQKELGFTKHVFGVDRQIEGDSMMPDVMPRYAKALGRHKDDKAID